MFYLSNLLKLESLSFTNAMEFYPQFPSLRFRPLSSLNPTEEIQSLHFPPSKTLRKETKR